MAEISVTKDITVKNPDQKIGKGTQVHDLIAVEAKSLLENPFVQSAVGMLPTSQTDFQLKVVRGGATVTLGTRVVENLTAIMPTAALAPFKQEYMETCTRIIELLDAKPESQSDDVRTSIESPDCSATRPSSSETDFQQNVDELQEIQLEQEKTIEETGALIDQLQNCSNADKSRMAELTDANEALRAQNQLFQEQIQELAGTNEALNQQKHAPAEEKQRFDDTITQLQGQVAELKGQKADLTHSLKAREEAAMQESKELGEQVRELVGKLASLEDEKGRLQRLNGELTTKAYDLEARLAEFKADNSRVVPRTEQQTVWSFGSSLDEEQGIDATLDTLYETYELQIDEQKRLIEGLEKEIAQLREVPAQQLQQQIYDFPAEELDFIDGDVLFDDELDIVLLKEQVARLERQNGEAVQSHDKIQKALLAKLKLQKELNHDLQVDRDRARDTVREMLAERKLQHPSFAVPQLREQLKKAKAELQMLRQQQYAIPKRAALRSSSNDEELHKALEKADALTEEITRQSNRHEAQTRQLKDQIARLEEELTKAEAGREHYQASYEALKPQTGLLRS